MNATILKISWAKALGMLIASLLSVQSLACHRSGLNPTSVSWDGINQEYVIGLRLDVGSGRTGVQYGADGDTRSITFAFYKTCTTITVNSYSPSQITGAFTNCTMPGMNLGPQGMPFNSQATIIYLDPGYYGIPPCVNQPFACISTTALCGNVATNSYNFTFRTSIMPDSIRVFGVEGNGNPLAGCYPDVDMTFALSESVSAPMPFNCLPPQQVPAGAGCLGVVPDFRPLAPLPPTCSSINNGFLTQVPAPGTVVGGLGSNLTVSFFAPNGNVLALTCTFSASVADLSPPTATCPGNFSIPATSGCNTATLNNLLYLGSITDNCDPNPAWIQSPPAGTVINSSAIVRFIGMDAYANADTCSFQLNVADILPPTLSCPPSQTVSLDALCQYALTDFLSQAVVADACDPNPTLAQSPLPGTVYTSPGNQVVTLTATDDGGNTSTCAMALQVVQPPTQVVCPGASSLPLSANCDATLPDFTAMASYQYLCQTVPIVVVQSPGPGQLLSGAGATTVTLTATDSAGGQSFCGFVVSRVDNQAPSLTCPSGQTLSLDANCHVALPDLRPGANASDNCTTSPTLLQSPAAGTVISGATTVTLTANDAAGNTSSCGVAVTVADQMPPNLNCPPGQAFALDANCQAALPDFGLVANASDNCTTIPTLIQSPVAGTVVSGPTTVTLTANDAAGNSSTCSIAVTATDLTPPGLTCPSAPHLALDANCEAALPDLGLTSSLTDNCTASPTLVQSPAAGTVVSGTVTVSLTATDAAGNTSSCWVVVTATDQMQPSLTCPPGQTLALDANCQVALPDLRPGANASDNCTTSPTLLQSPAAGTVISGATTVTLTANDAAGNTSSCGVAVAVVDQMPPNLTCPPGQAFALDANCQAALLDFRPGANASDNCTTIPTLIQSPVAGTVVSGPTTVTLTAADAAGNSTSCSIAVTATDLTPPGLTCPSNIALTPTYVTCQIPVFWAAPNATDNCGATLTASHQPGDVFPVGLSTVTYTAQDPEGNTTTCTFNIHVMPPSLSGTTVVAPSQPCQGDSATLTTISGASQYLWSTGETSASIQASAIGWYWVDILLGPGCVTRDSVFLTFAPLPQPLVFQSGNQACTGAFATYQWYLNGQVLPGENAACTPLGLSGSYSVSVTDTNGCAAMSAGMLLVDTENPAAWDVAVHPNPADQYLVLEIPFLPEGSLELALYDMTGRMVLERFLECRSGSHQVETAALPSGQYLARLRGGDGKSRAMRIMVWHP